MSRLGKNPIQIPAGTQVKIENNFVMVKGPKGELKEKLHDLVKIEFDDKEIKLKIDDKEDKKQKSLWGLYSRLVLSMVKGVNTPYEKSLEINGVGYKASIAGNKIILNVGYSHPVNFILPDGVSGQIKENIITLSSIDKQLLGETAARIREVRKPEPYKGKGIKYSDEIIKRKQGKTSAK
jgi:large subunit ribosomal protein L6